MRKDSFCIFAYKSNFMKQIFLQIQERAPDRFLSKHPFSCFCLSLSSSDLSHSNGLSSHNIINCSISISLSVSTTSTSSVSLFFFVFHKSNIQQTNSTNNSSSPSSKVWMRLSGGNLHVPNVVWKDSSTPIAQCCINGSLIQLLYCVLHMGLPFS